MFVNSTAWYVVKILFQSVPILCVVLCQRVQEISEQYSSYRSRTAETVAAAVKRKEDVSTAVNVAVAEIDRDEE